MNSDSMSCCDCRHDGAENKGTVLMASSFIHEREREPKNYNHAVEGTSLSLLRKISKTALRKRCSCLLIPCLEITEKCNLCVDFHECRSLKKQKTMNKGDSDFRLQGTWKTPMCSPLTIPSSAHLLLCCGVGMKNSCIWVTQSLTIPLPLPPFFSSVTKHSLY